MCIRHKAAARSAGVGISGFNGDAELSLIDPEQKEAYLDFLRRSVEAAKKVGARSVTIHSNGLERAAWSLTTMTASATP